MLDVAETELETDVIEGAGHGWELVERSVDRALRRFYVQCAQLALLAMDNDGNLDLRTTGGQEDPRHPRHWLHKDEGSREDCRWCRLKQLAERTRGHLNWIETKPGDRWPMIVTVPVESIETWLLIVLAILEPGRGSLQAEREQRSTFKRRLYRRPVATGEDVEAIAVPMVRQLSPAQIQILRDHSHSFADFATQVEQARDEILTAPGCWA